MKFFPGLMIFGVMCSALMAQTTQSATGKGMFAKFVGVCQGTPNEKELWKYISVNRIECGGWGAVQPKRDVWNQKVLEDFGKTVLESRKKGIETLLILDYLVPWAAKQGAFSFVTNGKRYEVAAFDGNIDKRKVTITELLTGNKKVEEWGTDFFPPENVKDWENYVDRVVGFLSRPPYNLKYFQIWNEAHDSLTGFWVGGLDRYMETIHLPAAKIIRKYGCKVVYGGYPCCGTMQNYLDVLDRHHAWDTLDVLDIHYYPVSSWEYLYKRVAVKHPDIAIWQTEVGFTTDKSWVSNCYPRFFYWTLTHNWKPDRYKIFQFAYWSPPDPKAYGFNCNFMVGDDYSPHGKSLIALGQLLDAPVVKAYTDWKTKPSLKPEIDEKKSSAEGFDCGDRIVLAIHLADQNGAAIFTDWNETQDNIHIDNPSTVVEVRFPKIDLQQIKQAYRVSPYGTKIPVTLTAMGTKELSKGVKMSIPIMDTDSKDSDRQDSRDSKMYTFYLLLELKK